MSIAWPNGKRLALSLSFDDARPSNPDVGFPLLDRHGIKATWYVLPGQLDQRLDAWKYAATSGHEIGNHTVNHPCSCAFEFIRKWNSNNASEDYTLERMEREIIDANDQIHAKLGVRPKTFAYPCCDTFVGRGANVKSYVPLVAKYFTLGRAFPANDPIDPATCDMARVGAFSIDEAPFDRVRQLIENAASKNGWLIFVGHDIGPGGNQTVRTDTLEALCEYAKDPANGVWIDTVTNVADYLLGNVPGKA